jgi:DNA-binding CsgD family transcriptional regulator
MTLGEADLDAVLTLVADIHRVDDIEDFSDVALEGVESLVASDITSFNELDPNSDRLVFKTRPLDLVYPQEAGELFAQLAHTHPLVTHVATTGDGSARKISDFCTTEQFHASPLYEGLYGPLGVEYQMAINLTTPRPIIVAIAANRFARDFDERDRAVLNVVRPHIAQAWRNSRDRNHLRAMLHTTSAALANSGRGVLIASNPPQELTPGAMVLLYRYFGRPGRVSAFPDRVESWLSHQRDPHRDPLEVARPLSSRQADRKLVIRHLPGSTAGQDALVLHEQPAVPEVPRLGELGLSAREAEILSLVATGATNARIGEHLHLAAGTIKKHLDNIYVKLGVSGRVQATALLADTMAHHGGSGVSPTW